MIILMDKACKVAKEYIYLMSCNYRMHTIIR
jgi:hypothetical protein